MKFIKAVGREIYAGDTPVLLRGFGLGGWFLPEGYMWKTVNGCDRPRRMEAMIEKLCGSTYASSFWQRYLDYYITEWDFEFIAKEGFNSVRFPLNARHLYEKKQEHLVINEEMFKRIDQVIEWGKKYNVYVILDMHGAPGGQTGHNIDDSINDIPELFIEEKYEEELVFLWKELAKRYRDEAIVAGYDLLNEPIPDFHGEHNNKLLPLYRKLIREIRTVDQNHVIILEGLHWASDFSVFDDFSKEEAANNIMLQFHKYWSVADAESLQSYITKSEELNVPLFMGEGGENNNEWYTTAFPLFERLNMSWSFWAYKKMATDNSPITFEIPEGWDEVNQWIEGKCEIAKERAIQIFDNFTRSFRNFKIIKEVLNALKRQVPVEIPCEAYDDYQISSKKIEGAAIRINDPVSLVFEHEITGEESSDENVMVQLFSGDKVGYLFTNEKEEVTVRIKGDGVGTLLISLNSEVVSLVMNQLTDYVVALKCIAGEKQSLQLACTDGSVRLDLLYLS